MGEKVVFKRRAYLLIQTDPGTETEVMRTLRKMDGIVNIDFIHGEYDFICVLEGQFPEIDRTIVEVRKIPHIRKTTTLTAFDLSLPELHSKRKPKRSFLD